MASLSSEQMTPGVMLNADEIMTSHAITFRDPETGTIYVQTQLMQVICHYHLAAFRWYCIWFYSRYERLLQLREMQNKLCFVYRQFQLVLLISVSKKSMDAKIRLQFVISSH